MPAAGDTHTEMRWYWEPGHFQSTLGDKIIDRVTGRDASFGRELTDQDIDEVLAGIDAARTQIEGAGTPVDLSVSNHTEF